MLWQWNPEPMAAVFFQSVRDTLFTVLADPRHLGARPGVVMALHTWGRTLILHPARQAIAGIQSRLQGASPGQLSLAEAESGQLSLAAASPQTRSLLGRTSPDRGVPVDFWG